MLLEARFKSTNTLGLITRECIFLPIVVTSTSLGPLPMYNACCNTSLGILNITSLAGIKGNPGQSAYASSKAAITCFSKSLAKEVSSFGITINCLAPGFIETEMTEDLPEKYLEGRIGNSLLKRMGTIEEVANMVSYLTLEAPSFFVNQELVLDGGIN